MRKKLTGAERRQWVDLLLERYASTVWSSLTSHDEPLTDAEDAFVQVFVVAILRMTVEEARQPSEAFILDCIADVQQGSIPHVIVDEVPDETDSAEVTPAQAGKETSSIPSGLIIRTSQMMRANIAKNEALRHHRGPVWAQVGAAATVLVGLAGIAYGVSDGVLSHFKPSQPIAAKSSNSTVTTVPRDVGNLPVTTVATYTVSSKTYLDLSHVAVANNALFIGDLVETADNWPRITAFEERFDQGKSLVPSTGRPYSIELVPPAKHTTKSTSKTNSWQISKWSIHTMSHWLIAVVKWNDGTAATDEIDQVYAMNVSTGKFSLVRTLSPQTGVSNEFAVAVGANRIITQSALADTTGAPPLGLPIVVNGLTGQDPLRAFAQTSQIPASFGLMKSPIVTGDGLIFQGIAGKEATTSMNTATWYSLAWDGSLTRLYGPPIDGQKHWAIRGVTGSLWWVETTPDGQQDNGLQISMEPLTPTKPAVAARNLNNPVEQFGVSGAYMLWTEALDATHNRLVVVQVQ